MIEREARAACRRRRRPRRHNLLSALDLDLADSLPGVRILSDLERQQAVLESRLDLVLVGIDRQRNLALEMAMATLVDEATFRLALRGYVLLGGNRQNAVGQFDMTSFSVSPGSSADRRYMSPRRLVRSRAWA